MKKTVTINLGGIVFYIDEDAYQLLKNYLDNVKIYFTHQEGGREVVQDIENRISELLSERISQVNQPVEKSDIETIIAQVGQPEEIAGVEVDTEQEEERTNFQSGEKCNKKLFRSQDDRIISGVAGGLASYWNLDASLVRLVLLLLLFFSSGVVGWIYLAMAFFVPTAQTAIQKLQMRGEPINMDNIGRVLNEESLHASSSVQPKYSFFDRCIYVIGIIMKACLIGFGIIFIPVWLVLVFALLVVLVVLIANLVTGGTYAITLWGVDTLAVGMTTQLCVALSALIFFAIPLSMLSYYALQKVFKWTGLSAKWKWILFALWLISLVVLIVTIPIFSSNY